MYKKFIEILLDLIWVMMSLRKFVVKNGKMKNILIIKLIDLESKVKVGFLLVVKANQISLWKVHQKQIFSESIKMMLYWIRKKSRRFEKIVEVKSQVKDICV